MILDIPAAHGRLEALVRDTPDARWASIVCHPHPLHGGTMHNNVVYRMARALADAGGSVIRFNFRGVGRSTGQHDTGRGESDDVRDVLAFAGERYPGLPVVLAGFSFGARVGLAVGADDPRVAALLGVGLPLDFFEFGFLDQCPKQKVIVQGGDDVFGDEARVRRVFAAFAGPKHLSIIPGASHLFEARLNELERSVASAAQFILNYPPFSPTV